MVHQIEDPKARRRLCGRYVVCDLHHLPFRDQSFSFTHCSNVLEHVADPERAYAELRRVGRHGFAECPNAFRENWLIHPADHLWIIRWRNGVIDVSKPRVLRCAGTQILPLPFMPWLRLRFRMGWKIVMFLGDSILHVMYNETRW
jgi:ubiquinone/menaquinone biosynthesis C-methylase UbiE